MAQYRAVGGQLDSSMVGVVVAVVVRWHHLTPSSVVVRNPPVGRCRWHRRRRPSSFVGVPTPPPSSLSLPDVVVVDGNQYNLIENTIVAAIVAIVAVIAVAVVVGFVTRRRPSSFDTLPLLHLIDKRLPTSGSIPSRRRSTRLVVRRRRRRCRGSSAPSDSVVGRRS